MDDPHMKATVAMPSVGKTILVVGFTPARIPRDTYPLTGLAERGYTITYCSEESPDMGKYWRLFRRIRALRGTYDLLYVTYTSPVAAIIARLAGNKRIVYNALSPQYESAVLDRKLHSPYSLAAIKFWLTDFLAFHAANLLLIETNAQIAFIARTYAVRTAKCLRVWTGADEHDFPYDPEHTKHSDFTVVFRGTFMPFAGIDIILDAMDLLRNEAIRFRIVGRGVLKEYVRNRVTAMRHPNITLDIGFFSQEYIVEAMQTAHVSLGQFSTEGRAQRTITSKTFESLCLGLPFITGDAASTRELLVDRENCLYVPCGNPRALADAILSLSKNPEQVALMSRANRRLFERECTPRAIAADIVPFVEKLIG